MTQRKAKSVLISDIHYNLNNLDLADAALRAAISKANELDVNLIIAGDLHDTKANLRGECVKAIIDAIRSAERQVQVLIGNHDLINEKSKAHSLYFLHHYAAIQEVEGPDPVTDSWLIPYQADPMRLKQILSRVPKGATIIMHQGVIQADKGDYIQDRSAIPAEYFADFRVISGHYHKAQDIKCGRPRKGGVGLFSYIGSPYTMSFGEANDGPKGFQILYDDGLLEQVPLDLRKHVIVETTAERLTGPLPGVRKQDLLWLKIRGPKSSLLSLKKKVISSIIGRDNFKLDLIPESLDEIDVKSEELVESFLLDRIISQLNESEEHKNKLKQLWRSLMEDV